MTRPHALSHRFLLWATLWLWSLAALLPPATMLAPSGDGTIQLVLCSGEGMVTVSLPDPDHDPDAPDHGAAHDHTPCPFAAAHIAAALIDTPAQPVFTGNARPATATMPTAPTPGLTATGVPQARAPPFQSA